MGYTGYRRYLCSKGHLTEQNHMMDDLKKCHCGLDIVWENGVDLTNGSFCGCGSSCKYCDNGRIDGYIELEVKEEVKQNECTHCGRFEQETLYKVPDGRINN